MSAIGTSKRTSMSSFVASTKRRRVHSRRQLSIEILVEKKAAQSFLSVRRCWHCLSIFSEHPKCKFCTPAGFGTDAGTFDGLWWHRCNGCDVFGPVALELTPNLRRHKCTYDKDEHAVVTSLCAGSCPGWQLGMVPQLQLILRRISSNFLIWNDQFALS